MSDRSQFVLDLDGVQLSPSPYGQSVGARRSIRKTLLAGDADDNVRAIFAYEAVMAASATVPLDLRTTTDRFGANLLADDLVMLYVENVDDPSGGGALEVRPNATNGFTNLLGTGSALKLPPGAFAVVGCFKADAIDVTVTNKALDFVEAGGTLPVLLRIQLWVRR